MSSLPQPPDSARAAPSAPVEAAVESPANKTGGSRWRLRLGVAWIAAVLAAYYLLHPPFSQTFLTALFAPSHQLALDWQTPLRLMGHAADLLVAFWLLLLGAALGQQFWRWCRLPAAEETVQIALGAGLGLGALSLLTFVFGLAGWLSFWTVGAGLIFLSILCARAGWWVLRWLREQMRQMARAIRQASWLDRLLWGYILLTVLLMALSALLPPTAWDALMYHLAVPAADLQQGRVLPATANFQGYQPELVEMLYLDGLLLRGDGPAALLHLGFGLLGLLTLVALARQLPDRARGAALALRAAALFLSIPSLVLVLGWPYIDGALVYYELAALLALLCWWNAGGKQRVAWLALAGVLLGMGLDTKYTAAFAIGALALLVCWRAFGAGRLEGWRPALWQGALLVGAAVLVGSPWLWRNLFLTGDPLFPYHLGHLFPAGPAWDDVRTQYALEGPGWGLAQSWRLLTLPLEVTLFGTQGTTEFDATLGPLLLLLLPPGLLAWQRSSTISIAAKGVPLPDQAAPAADAPAREEGESAAPTSWPQARSGDFNRRISERQMIGVLLAFAALLALCWDAELLSVHFARQSRLFFPLFAALTLPVAAAWLRLRKAAAVLPGLHRLVSLAVLLVLALGLLSQMAGVLGNGNAPYLLGLQSRDAYLADHLDPYYAAIQRVNALPASARVLSLWEVRSYYTSRSIYADPFLDNFNYYYRHYPTAQQLAQALHQEGFTHVLFYAQGLQLVLDERSGEVSQQEFVVLQDFLTRYVRPVYQDTFPLVRGGQGPLSPDERILGQRGWYRLYALTGP
jgi:hypothetical protein